MVISVWSLFLCLACSQHSATQSEVDRLNNLSYYAHYRNLDSTKYYAERALLLSDSIDYNNGRVQALFNLTFHAMAKLDYHLADSLLRKVSLLDKSDIQNLIYEVNHMRLCQRRALNKEFYHHKTRAEYLIDRLSGKVSSMSEKDRAEYVYARSEYGIVLSTYFYYVNLTDESSQALLQLQDANDINIHEDPAQWLNYIYNVGSGGILTKGTREQIHAEEFDYLFRCYVFALKNGYLYWQANSLQAMSEHLMTDSDYAIVEESDAAALRYINDRGVDRGMLAGYLAERALELFYFYGDKYQISGAWRTLSECYFQVGDYESALQCLNNSIADSIIYQAPDLVSSIDERLSIAYSAFDEKQMSDYYRNQYLDIQDTTRQDRQLEARAETLQKNINQMRLIIVGIVLLLLLMVVVMWYFIRHRHKRKGLLDVIEELQENISALELQVDDAKRLNVVQRAKISYVESILPLIDRMLLALKNMKNGGDFNKEYVTELCTSIISYNESLTRWVQLRKGSINLKVESFPLQELFEVIRLSESSFAKSGLKLDVADTDIWLKADKALTLFMLNTIADNARKHTPEGGTVSVTSKAAEDGYAEIVISDTGCGMTEEQVAHLFDYKVIDNSNEALTVQKSHGFGLMNCKGIINRYRKIGSIFSNVSISVDSVLQKGTSIKIRLPRVVKTIALVFTLVTLQFGQTVANGEKLGDANKPVSDVTIVDNADVHTVASRYVDSMYVCNVAGRYADAVAYADKCRSALNSYYLSRNPASKDTLMRYDGKSERIWWDKKFDVNFNDILAMRNECAVAALALHDWELYNANNSAYTKLLKECTADSTLNNYCISMTQIQRNSNYAIMTLICLVVLFVVMFYVFYVREVIKKGRQQRNTVEEMRDRIKVLSTERDRLHVANSVIDNSLSTLKHETMYYPSRIYNMVKEGESQKNICELASYYRSIYSLLATQCSRISSLVPYKGKSIDLIAYLNGKGIECEMPSDLKTVSVRVNEGLLDYLMALIKKKNSRMNPDHTIVEAIDNNYVSLRLYCPQLEMGNETPSTVFSSSTSDYDYLVMKQIMREIGAITNAFRTGITVTPSQELVLILPARISM